MTQCYLVYMLLIIRSDHWVKYGKIRKVPGVEIKLFAWTVVLGAWCKSRGDSPTAAGGLGKRQCKFPAGFSFFYFGYNKHHDKREINLLTAILTYIILWKKCILHRHYVPQHPWNHKQNKINILNVYLMSLHIYLWNISPSI